MSDTEYESLPLEESLYNPSPDDIVLLKKLTGIENEDELKKHALEIQAQAYAVYPYPCIRSFSFTSFKISRYPFYQEILKIGKERPGAVYLELGCCFGNDARRVISDGYPTENVIASDLRADYWEIAQQFFNTDSSTFPVPFLQGDIFDPSFASAPPPLPTSTNSPLPSHPPLSSLTSLTPLAHQISVIHAALFFHLFGKKRQTQLAHLLAGLLSPLPGSMIVGSHLGMEDIPENKEGGTRVTLMKNDSIFAHSPTSWKALWQEVFGQGVVEVWAKAIQLERKHLKKIKNASEDRTTAWWMMWSVKRI